MDRTLENPVKSGAEGARLLKLISQAKGQSVPLWILFFLRGCICNLSYFVFKEYEISGYY